jgi:hypothetical protein
MKVRLRLLYLKALVPIVGALVRHMARVHAANMADVLARVTIIRARRLTKDELRQVRGGAIR